MSGWVDKPVNDVVFSHEVVGIQLIDECSLITAWRKHKKLTHGELAKVFGISPSALSKIERPDSKPQAVTLRKIAKALEVRSGN